MSSVRRFIRSKRGAPLRLCSLFTYVQALFTSSKVPLFPINNKKMDPYPTERPPRALYPFEYTRPSNSWKTRLIITQYILARVQRPRIQYLYLQTGVTGRVPKCKPGDREKNLKRNSTYNTLGRIPSIHRGSYGTISRHALGQN